MHSWQKGDRKEIHVTDVTSQTYCHSAVGWVHWCQMQKPKDTELTLWIEVG